VLEWELERHRCLGGKTLQTKRQSCAAALRYVAQREWELQLLRAIGTLLRGWMCVHHGRKWGVVSGGYVACLVRMRSGPKGGDPQHPQLCVEVFG
jgi:hypothetical protein